MSYLEIQIGKCCVPTEQTDPRRLPEESFEYIDISSIDKDSKQIVSTTKIAGRDAPSRARKLVRKGDVLVSTVRPNLNAVAIVPPELDGEIASTGFCVLRAKTKLLNERYLFYRTITTDFINFLVANMRGANYPAVTDGVVKEAIIPLPPPKEQRRIVEILDQADELRRKRAEADSTATRILPALFIKMFGDPATNPKGWNQKPLEKICDEIYRYPTYYGIEYVEKGVPEIRGELILPDGSINEDTARLRFISEDTSARFPKTILRTNDIVMSVRGTIGKMALVPKSLEGSNITANLLRIAPNHEFVTGEYLYSFLSSSAGRGGIGTLTTNTTIQTIKTAEFKKMPILVPPKDKQITFTQQMKSIKEILKRAENATKNIETLFSLLLHRAFSGELTAQWREAHLKELLEEMEIMRRELDLSDSKAARLF